MIEYWTGALCASLAGHDKGELFVIIGESKEYVSLVNGASRPLAKPKRKKKKHIQIIHDQDQTRRMELICEEKLTDEEIRKLIRCYKRESQV